MSIVRRRMCASMIGPLLLGVLAAVSVPVSIAAQTPPTPPPTTQTRVVRIGRSEQFSPQTGAAALAAFAPAVQPVDSGGDCTVTHMPNSNATVVSAAFPSHKVSQTTVVLTFDSVGHLVRYSERRGIRPTIAADRVSTAQRDSAFREMTEMRATTVMLDWPVDQGMVLNRGGDAPIDAVIGSVKAVSSAPQLGPVTDRLERVRRLCGV